MDEFFFENRHECNYGYSHASYQVSVQEEIQRYFVVVKFVAPTRNSMVMLCLPRTAFIALQDPHKLLSQPHEHLDEIEHLRDQLVVVKCPVCPLMMEVFRKEQKHHKYVQSLPGVLTLLAINELPYPYMTVPWVRGISLDDFINYAKQINQRIQPAFVWHIAVCLLEVVIELRCGYPLENGDRYALAHNNLHPRNLMLDVASSYPPFPNLLVVDFGRATTREPIGPWTQSEEERLSFVHRLRQDLQQIGLVLHALAHAQHLAHREDRIWSWNGYIIHGICACSERRVPEPNDFNSKDTDFALLLKSLLGAEAYLMNDNSLNQLLETARRRREEATQALVGGPQNRVFDYAKWNYSRSLATDQDIVSAVDQWVWELFDGEFI